MTPRERLIALAEKAEFGDDFTHEDLDWVYIHATDEALAQGIVFRSWLDLRDAVRQRRDLVEGVITFREIDDKLHGFTAADDARDICEQKVEDAVDALLGIRTGPGRGQPQKNGGDYGGLVGRDWLRIPPVAQDPIPREVA